MRMMYACVVLSALIACSAPTTNTLTPSASTPFAASLGEQRMAATSVAVPQQLANAENPLFIAETCNAPAVCSPSGGLVHRPGGLPITDGIANPVAMVLDTFSTLYVSNAVTVNTGNITVYSAGSGHLTEVLTGFKGPSYALAMSPRGELYVVSHFKNGCCNIKGSVAVYEPGKTQPDHWLSDIGAFPGKPAFDPSGNYYQPNFYNFPGFISAYAPGESKPYRVLNQGIGFPLALAFDSHGTLYVLNGVFSGGTDILVYNSGADAPSLTITEGVSNASAIALDAAGELFVANRGEGNVRPSVSVYASGTSAPTRTIVTGIHEPSTLAFDAAGNLYVGNAPVKGPNSVTVYAPNSGIPNVTFDLNEAPTALAVR